MKIPYVNLSEQYRLERKKLLKKIDKTLLTGQFVGGEEIEKFENNIKKLCKVKYCLGLNSGTDALTLGLFSIGVKSGDEIITPPNSFIASTAVIAHLGAIPKFVDVRDDLNIDPKKIEKSITSKTKAIMPVHLSGRPCEMDKIMSIANKHKIPVIEDAAQAIGSKFKKKTIGSFGKINCFSAHPLKNLNAVGDSGFITTNDKKIYEFIKNLSNHGRIKNKDIVKKFGYVSRMDNLQATILNFRLNSLNKVINKRRNNAKFYFNYLKNHPHIKLPVEKKDEFNTYHTFVIQAEKRDMLHKYLASKNIGSVIHYPIPIHLQPAAKKFNYRKGSFPITEKQAKKILSIPIHQFMNKSKIEKVSEEIIKFYKKY